MVFDSAGHASFFSRMKYLFVSLDGLIQGQKQAYNRVRNVMIPNMYYREDVGDRWSEEDSDRLHSWGYLRE